MHKLFVALLPRRPKLRSDQRGLVTMELVILIVLVVIIYLIYKRVAAAQH